MASNDDNYRSLVLPVEQWVRDNDELMLAVARESLKQTVEAMQTPVREGGRMRVDTGFLRTSGRANLNGYPSGEAERPANAKPNSYQWNGEAIDAVLRRMKLGDTFNFGWTANYAPVREVYDGFMETELQNWNMRVNRVVARIKR